MTHPEQDTIYEIARKEVNGELLSDEEVALKNHFVSCETCRGYFLDYMQVLDFLSDGKFAPYLMEAVDRAKTSRSLLFQMQFIMQAAGGLQVISDQLSKDRPVFTQVPLYAMARGVQEEVSEFTADASIIRYDHEKHSLTVSIDEELAQGSSLTAVLTVGGETLRQRLEPDGHGMLETEFHLKSDTDFGLKIEVER